MFEYEYPRPMVTVDVCVFCGESKRVLLIQRKNEPFQDMWALPGGYVEMKETLVQAAQRELREETGFLFDLEDLTFAGTYDAVNRDPRGRTFSCVFATKTVARVDQIITAGDDAKDAGWMLIGDLPPLAFDHAVIITEIANMMKLKRGV